MRTCQVCGQQNISTRWGPATCPTCSHEKRLIRQRGFNKRYRQTHKSKLQEYKRIYNRRVRNDPKLLAQCKAAQVRYNHSEEGKAVIAHYGRSQERKTARARYYRSEKGKLTNARYRARKHGAIVLGQIVTAEDWLQILKAHKNRCYYCHKRKILEMDHVIPLSKGGKHVKENIVPACHHCNSAKNNQIIRLL